MVFPIKMHGFGRQASGDQGPDDVVFRVGAVEHASASQAEGGVQRVAVVEEAILPGAASLLRRDQLEQGSYPVRSDSSRAKQSPSLLVKDHRAMGLVAGMGVRAAGWEGHDG